MATSVLLRKKSILAAKIETTPGTAISLGASNATFNVYNLSIQPSIQMSERPGQGSFGRLPSVQGARSGTFEFDTDLIGGASAPAWATTFLPACGWVASSLTFSPKTEVPGTNVKTLTLGGYRNGLYKQIRGAMGTWRLELTPGQPGMVHFTFTGIWDDPTDVSLIAPTYVTTIPPRFAASTLTLDSFNPKVSRASFDAGNQVYLRPDASDASGYAYACISDRLPKVTLDPEADLVANRDTYGIWKALTTAALTCTVGTTGNAASFTAPKLQTTNVQEGERSGVNIDSIEYQCNKSTDAGDDELAVTFS